MNWSNSMMSTEFNFALSLRVVSSSRRPFMISRHFLMGVLVNKETMRVKDLTIINVDTGHLASFLQQEIWRHMVFRIAD